MLKGLGTLGVVVAAFSLSGCGSSSVSRDVVFDDAVPDVDTTETRTFADVNGDGSQIQSFAAALASGETVYARDVSTSAVRIGFDGTAAQTTSDLRLRVNDAGEITMILNGVEHVFTEEDRFIDTDGNFVGYDVQDPETGEFYGIFTYSTFDMGDFFDPENPRFAQTVRAHSSRVTEDGSVWAFAITGAETRDDALAGLPTGTYSGRSVTDIYPVSGVTGISASRDRLFSDVNMVADFGAASVSGNMTNLRVLPAGESAVVGLAGQISMDPATLNGNGFSSTLTANSDFTSSNGITLTGEYSGAFYGASAEGVAGGVSIQGTGADSEAFVGHGFFGADLQ